MAKKWLDSIEKHKRRIDLKEQLDRRRYRQSQRQKIIDSSPRLGAESITVPEKVEPAYTTAIHSYN